MNELKILVIGDSCTDIFIYGDTPRLSPEGPAPVFIPTKTTTNPGMAGNVKRNLVSLGSKVDLVTNTEKITKTRYVDETFNNLLLRVDENDSVSRIDQKILKKISFHDYDVVVVSDYNKGFLTEQDIAYIAHKHPKVVCDTKKRLDDWCKDIAFIKLNRSEFQNNLTYLENNNWAMSKLIITLDKEGCLYNDILFSTGEVEIMDISGAGDTFVAAFSFALGNGRSVEEAITLSNQAASRVVQKRGVSTL